MSAVSYEGAPMKMKSFLAVLVLSGVGATAMGCGSAEADAKRAAIEQAIAQKKAEDKALEEQLAARKAAREAEKKKEEEAKAAYDAKVDALCVLPEKMPKKLAKACDQVAVANDKFMTRMYTCLLYTSPSPRDVEESRMPSSA